METREQDQSGEQGHLPAPMTDETLEMLERAGVQPERIAAMRETRERQVALASYRSAILASDGLAYVRARAGAIAAIHRGDYIDGGEIIHPDYWGAS